MKGTFRKATNSLQRGQTLVMALIILGVLLVLGVVFLALIGRNIRHTSANQQRSIAYDLAEAGVRAVHSQMISSPDGADWRPTLTLAVGTADPDYEYLRLPLPGDPNDKGGPDKQGPYSRLIFDRGRALVRVRFAPSDPTIFSSKAIGDFLQPGMARNYTVIESVGKARSLNLNDPTSTSLLNGQTREVVESKKVVGFVSCGLIEQARFITDKNHLSRAAEIGVSEELGATYDEGSFPINVNVPMVLGGQIAMFNPYNPSVGGPTPSAPVYSGGSLRSNVDLIVHGTLFTNLNPTLGDHFVVAGSIRGADDQSMLRINLTSPNGATWNQTSFSLVNNGSPSLNSDGNNFSTIQGSIIDFSSNSDAQGFPRGAKRSEPPSLLTVDADTGLTRYLQMTQLSGKSYAFGNAGRWGFGQGIYVNNVADVQIPIDEQGREDVGSAQSLVYDWLNPSNGQAGSGWKGPFYVPRGAFLRLMNDGFTIVRDGKAPANQRSWREPDGSPSKRPGASMTSVNPADIVDSPYIRYKIVFDPATRQNYIFNSYSVNAANQVIDITTVNSNTILNPAVRAAGYPFNGVLYFAGNVRVRGEIPTNSQITVVSGATIYIEGSITKGTTFYANNGSLQRLTTPSRSMLALLAKDYVTLNTTQFFGTSTEANVEEVKDNPGPVEWNPIRVRTGGGVSFTTEFDLDPNTPAANGGVPSNPSTFKPFASQYVEFGTSNFEMTNLLLVQATDDGPAPVTFTNMNINYGLGTAFGGGVQQGQWQYLFELSNTNSATPFYPVGYTPPNYTVANVAPLYGLGSESWQRYSKFEANAFPIVTPNTPFSPATMQMDGTNANRGGVYHLRVDDGNDFSIGLNNTVGGTPTNDYVLARAAIIPHDIRIEATIFAEEGSFFVIPGPWFNPNPNDRRDTYVGLGTTTAERDLARLEAWGSTPNMPFYGEPLDVKISILGSVSENMPPPMNQQAEWMKKWGWIPRYHGASGQLIPAQHVPAINPLTNNPYDLAGADQFVPNITITYDPVLATGRNFGYVGAFGAAVDSSTLIRYQAVDLNGDGLIDNNDVYFALPPLPRMPVSPTLAYFGEVNP